MRRFGLTVVAAVMLTILIGATRDQSEEISRIKEENQALKALAGPPPGSLEKLFPPKAEGPVFLFKMFQLGTPFAGIAVDMFENDVQQAKANFQRFKAQYLETSKLVPEWEKAYPTEPVDELGRALETGDRGKVMAAFDKVGKVCHDCHAVNMVNVQQKYHWGDFSKISVTDPVTKETVGFGQLMWYLESPFVGIGVDLEQGQVENALKHFEALNSRFQSLKETCGECHDTEMKYFVDQSVRTLMDKLRATLRTARPDPKQVAGLSQQIGTESCFKCHLVHLPAAMANARWEAQKRAEGRH